MKFKIVCSLILVVFTVSCKNPAMVDAEDKAVFVVPFNMLTETRSVAFYSSQLGTELAKRVSNIVRRRVKSASMIYSSKQIQDAVTNPLLKTMDWKKVCEEDNIDIVLQGTIREIQIQDKKNLSVLQGKLVIDLTFYSGKTNEKLYSSRRTYHYPKLRSANRGYNVGIPVVRGSPEEIKRGLLGVTAAGIAEMFYAHTVEED